MSFLSKLGIAASIADFSVKKLLQDLISTTAVAAAGSDQTDATAITAAVNFVTASDGTKGVILPVAEINMSVEVVNTVSNQDLKVYPNTGAQINSLTATTGAFTVVAGASRTFFCDALLHWYVGAGNLSGTATSSSTAELNYNDIAVLGTGAASKAVVLDTGEDYTWPATGVLTYGVLKDPAGTTLGATVAELNMAADNSANTEVVAATNVITAAESGKTFFLDHATEFVSTLPAPALGLRYTFIVVNPPETASYTVVTDSAAQVLGGHVLAADGNAGDVESPAAGTTITFVDGASVAGDRVDVISDGTSWYAQCTCAVATGITITG